ncbi:hypothetical protein LguiB_014929 [Lonicera macranthoides]
MTTSSSRKTVGEQSFSSKRKRKDSQSNGKKRKSKYVQKAVKKVKRVDKSYGNESSRLTVFRCNLVAIVEEIARMKARGDIRQCHIGATMRTPFGGIFKAIFEEKIILDHVGMIGQVGKQIISAYSEEDNAFLIAGEAGKLTPDDVSVTFGLPKHGRKFTLQSSGSVCDSEFIRRRFRGESTLKVGAASGVGPTWLDSAIH